VAFPASFLEGATAGVGDAIGHFATAGIQALVVTFFDKFASKQIPYRKRGKVLALTKARKFLPVFGPPIAIPNIAMPGYSAF